MKLSRHVKLLLVVVAVVLSALPLESSAQRRRARGAEPRQGDNTERKIDALLARMTLEEKLGQLQQLDGDANGQYKAEQPELVRKGLLGSTLNVRGARISNELQRIAVEESRLKIPMLFGFDVIHGYRTIFPIPLGEAASWDPAAVERAAYVAAKREARSAERAHDQVPRRRGGEIRSQR